MLDILCAQTAAIIEAYRAVASVSGGGGGSPVQNEAEGVCARARALVLFLACKTTCDILSVTRIGFSAIMFLSRIKRK